KMLECEGAALAAIHRTDEDCQTLERLLEGLSGKPTVLEQAKLDLAFHDHIARASRNPVIHLMFASISDLTVGLMVRSLSDRQVSQRGLPFHDEVLDAVVERDPERARRAMGDHLGTAEELYGADLDRSISDLVPAELRAALDVLPGLQVAG
ncbi:MAG: FCD domain-containing protein, partial [Deltaproteobacteria bacterium]|nr:FCD domain-containing protein [Deltaproteobacteria bacterium]